MYDRTNVFQKVREIVSDKIRTSKTFWYLLITSIQGSKHLEALTHFPTHTRSVGRASLVSLVKKYILACKSFLTSFKVEQLNGDQFLHLGEL